MREPNPRRARPVEHRRRESTRLCDERYVSGTRAAVREARVEAYPRHQEPDAVRTEDAQRERLGRLQHRLGQRQSICARLLEAGSDDDRRAGAASAQLRNDSGNGRRGRAHHGELGDIGELRHGPVGGAAGDLRASDVDGPDRTCKSALQQIAHHRGTNAVRAVGRPDQCHRAGVEQVLEVATAHESILSPRAVRVHYVVLRIDRGKSLCRGGRYDLRMSACASILAERAF